MAEIFLNGAAILLAIMLALYLICVILKKVLYGEPSEDDGSGFGHSYSMRDCIAEIDLEIERENSPSYLQ